MKQAIATTSWDDGDPLDLRIAELLAKYDMPGTFYVPLQPRKNGELLSERQLRTLDSTFEIGAHTVSHVDLTTLSPAMSQVEISESKLRLEHLLGHRCLMFSPPKGRFRQSHIAYAQESGFLGVRTVEMMSFARPTQHGDIFILPTSIQAMPLMSVNYLKNIAKRLSLSNLMHYMRYCRGKSWLTACVQLLDAAISNGGVFHLWGHSWEIDKYNQWGEFEQLLRIMNDQRDRVKFGTNSDVCAAMTPS